MNDVLIIYVSEFVIAMLFGIYLFADSMIRERKRKEK